MKKLYSGCLITLLLVGMFNGCDECMNLPEPSKPSFELSTRLDKNTLYLEAHEMAKITLTLEAKNEAAHKCEYTIVKWEGSAGLQGQLLDANLSLINEQTQLVKGDNILYYNPLKIGEHNLKLAIADQYGFTKKEVILDPITVKEKKELPFHLKLETPAKSIFTHQQAKLSLSIFSKEKEHREESAKLIYTVKEVEDTKGSLYLESSGEAIKKDTKLAFGKQTLLFKPAGETGEAHIRLLVESNKGSEGVASIFLTIQPIDFKVSAFLKEASQEGAKLTQEDVALLEIMLSAIDPDLVEESWRLVSWSYSDGVIRDIINEKGEALTVYPLSAQEKNKLYVKLNDLGPDTSQTLTLTIEGPGKMTKEISIPLLPVLKSIVGVKAQTLLTSSEKKNKKAKDYLHIPAKASNYDSIKEAREEVEKDIDKLSEIITSLQSNYGMSAESMPALTAKHLKKAQRNIASLEKKKNKLDKLKRKSGKERSSFKVELLAASKAIYSHRESIIDLQLSSSSQNAAKQTYEVKGIVVSGGTLVAEKNHQVVEVGTRLIFGTQKLIFKPSGEIGEAIIKLIVASEKGNESSARLNLDVKAVSFQVALEAHAKSMFAHQGAEVNLVITSDEKEAEDLVYSIKEVQGSLFLKNTGEKLEPGTKLHYGTQTLVFKPAIDPKDISEYQALLEQKKSLSITQGDKKDTPDQPTEGAKEMAAISTRIEDLKIVIQSSKELVVKPLGGIQANLSLSVTSRGGGENKSLVVLDVKPVGFQLGATAREAQEEEKALIEGDFVVVELELSQIESTIAKEGWRLTSWKFNNKIDVTIVDEKLRKLPSYELKTDGKNMFYLKLDKVDIHDLFDLTLTVEGPSEAIRVVTLSLASAYQGLVEQDIVRQVSAIKEMHNKIISYLQKPVKEREYNELKAISEVAKGKTDAFNAKYTELNNSQLLSSLKEKTVLKNSVREAIDELEASSVKLNKEQEAWNSSIAPLGKVEELVEYMNSPNKAGNYLLHMWSQQEPIDTEAGKFILARTSDINCVNREGKTALQLAIENKNLDKANLLLMHKADVNVKFADGKPPLLYVLEKEGQGKHELTEALLKAGANPNIALDSKGLMPLHVALQNKDLDKGTLLLKYKASPNSKFTNGETPLAYVIRNTAGVQREELMRVLIQHGSDQNALEIQKSLLAIEKLSKDMNAYLAKGVKERDYTTLKLLLKQAQGQVELFDKRLGSVKSEPKILAGVLRTEIGEALKKMIDQGVPSLRKELARAEEEYKAWHEAIKSVFGVKTEAEIEKYIQHVYTADKDGNYLIHLWAEKDSDNQEAGEFILQRMLDINAKNNQGSIPLHLAIKKWSGSGDLSKVLQLLKHGADPNIKYPDGAYPLFSGLIRMDYLGYQLVAALLDHGAWAEVESSSDFPGWPPLLFAIRYDNSSCQEDKIKKLLQHGAKAFKPMSKGRYSLYYEDYNGWTPLHAAAEQGKTNIVKLLLEYGAKEYKGYTARIFYKGKFQEWSAMLVMDNIPDNTRMEIKRLINP